MSRHHFRVGVIALCCALTLAAAGGSAQVATRDLSVARQQALAIASNWQGFTTGEGPCRIVQASQTSKKLWAAVLGCGPSGQVAAGFRLPPLSLGSPLSNVKVFATFQVTGVAGPVKLQVVARKLGAPYGLKEQTITQPGTYTVSGPDFDLTAGDGFVAEAAVLVGPCDFCGVSTKVVEIKWQF